MVRTACGGAYGAVAVGSQGLKGAIHDGDDIAMEEEGDNINPLDIDAYWLQREVAKYPGFDDPVKAQKMAGSAVTAGLTHGLMAVTIPTG